MSKLTMEQVIKHCEMTVREKERFNRMSCEWAGVEVHPPNSRRYWEHKLTAEWLKELQQYKELEEQGRLIEVVRCKDCRHEQYCKQAQHLGADGYCSKAELKELKGDKE